MPSIDQPLNGKILLITGGASGIGLEVTKQAYDLGAKILVADVQTTAAFDAFAAGKKSNNHLVYVESDVCHWAAFDKLFAACEAKWGDVPDAYALCAGVFDPPFSNFWHDPEQDEGYRQVDVNVNHPIKLTRMAIRKSLQKGKRSSVCIIQQSSVAGLSGNIAAPLYCATKHAIVGFVKSMKDTEPLTGVKITTLCPAAVMTPLFDAQKQKQFFSHDHDHDHDHAGFFFLKPHVVAAQLLDLLQNKERPCGTVLEMTLQRTRVIPEWNVAPPEGQGTGQECIMDDDVLGNLLEPIKAALRRDQQQSTAKL
ncbi:hypothetical protein ACEQ8H_005063 [Pleosporales sp. CAS-2024a]